MRYYLYRVGELTISGEESASLITDDLPTQNFNNIFRRIVRNSINLNAFIDYKWIGKRRLTVVCYCPTCNKHFKVYGPIAPVAE